ncbi:putative NYN domain, limkain-b1-type, meiosis regulator and mRNA stability factor 1 [Arabidopsis thaliana]
MLKAMDSRNTNEAKQESKTMVWWDINSCPVPDGYDARMVAQFIKSELKKAGYPGPLTITAIGNLKHTLKRTPGVLQAISSTGIFLKYVPDGFREIFEELLLWKRKNLPPANIMLITGDVKEVKRLSNALSNVERTGYTLLQAYHQSASYLVNSEKSTTLSLMLSKKCIWEKLLQGTRRQELDEKFCETGESPCRFFCALCKFAGQSFEDFITHLKGKDHIVRVSHRPCLL